MSPAPPPTLAAVIRLLRKHRFHFRTEEDLQEGIAQVLAGAEIPFEREVILGPRDRIDFLAGTVGIEVKVAGSFASVLRQVERYSRSPRIRSLLLVTARSFHCRINGVSKGVKFDSLVIHRGLR